MAHGPQRSPEKPLKSIKTFERSYDYIYNKIDLLVQEEKIFKFRECILAILLLSPVVKRCDLSIWTNVNPLHPEMLSAKFSWNWPWIRHCIFVISLLFRPEKRWAHHLNKLETSSLNDNLCQLWFKLAQGFWRRWFFKFMNGFSLFR